MEHELQREEALAELAARRAEFVAFVGQRVPEADIEDLVHQAWTRAFQKRHTLRDTQRAVPWFYRILRRAIADLHARRAAQANKLHLLAADIEAQPLEDDAACACALNLLTGLPENQQDILRRIDLEDEPVAEVAAFLGITRNNTAVRLHRARLALRRRLLEVCGARAADDCATCDCED